VTSLFGRSLDDQIANMESWRAAGFDVYTLNHTYEAAELKPSLPHWVTPYEIHFDLKFDRYFVPLNALFLAVMQLSRRYDYTVFCNSDIFCDTPAFVRDFDRNKDAFIISHRVDVEAPDQPLRDAETYQKGFDVFKFPAGFRTALGRNHFYIGLPWWDYYLPCRVIAEGHTLKRYDAPAFGHLIHKQNWYKGHFLDLYHCFLNEFDDPEFEARIKAPTGDTSRLDDEVIKESARAVVDYINDHANPA